jgi:UDP-2,3-diacylglucosamine hydrolase
VKSGPDLQAAWQAPAAWRAIEFISDLHLWEPAPRTFEAWLRWLRETDADALFILGDLFEVWIGDDARATPFHGRCVQALAEASQRRPVYFICGNRDFLIGPAMLAACGLQPLPDPTRLDAFGETLLLSHGDALCVDDHDYQRFRKMVRDAGWQAQFLARPMAERAALARQIRADSQGRKQASPDPAAWADVDRAQARHWLQTRGARTLVHGHTHRPAEHDLGDGFRRIVLTDWDFDGSAPRGEALRLDTQGWHRRPVAAVD